MASAYPKIILLTGAPDVQSLNWDDSTLSTRIEPAISAFLSRPPQTPTQPPTSTQQVTWRALPGRPTHLPTGNTPRHLPQQPFQSSPPGADLSFLSTSSLSQPPNSSSSLLSEFYTHSLSLPLPSPPPDDTSFSTTTSSFLSSPVPHPIPPTIHLTPLAHLPPASHLLTLPPQTTPTYNLLVGLIAPLTPKAITTRSHPPREMELHELLVGDDTKAGFSISFWLPQAPGGDEETERTRRTLEGVRSRDILLLRGVALSVFRGRVFGRSLRGGRTGVWVLRRGGEAGWRAEGDEEEGWKGRAREVAAWVERFVAPAVGAAGMGGAEVLPGDTQ